MIIELDYEFTDEIVRQELVETYVKLSKDIKNNKNMDEDDLEMYKEVVAAIEVLSKWYFLNFQDDVEKYNTRKVKK